MDRRSTSRADHRPQPSKPRTAADRARDARLRKKLGYKPFGVDLPPTELQRFLIETGRLSPLDQSKRAICRALSIWICLEIHLQDLASRRDGKCRDVPARACFSPEKLEK